MFNTLQLFVFWLIHAKGWQTSVDCSLNDKNKQYTKKNIVLNLSSTHKPILYNSQSIPTQFFKSWDHSMNTALRAPKYLHQWVPKFRAPLLALLLLSLQYTFQFHTRREGHYPLYSQCLHPDDRDLPRSSANRFNTHWQSCIYYTQ